MTEIKRNDEGIPVCPDCGAAWWGEHYRAEVHHNIDIRRSCDKVTLEWGLYEARLDGSEVGQTIYCRGCGEDAPEEVAEAVYAMID